MIRVFILLLLLVGCGNGKQTVEVQDSEHTVGGETLSRIIVELPFINQVNELCKDLYLVQDFDSIELYNQQVAQCTFDNISILNIDGISQDEFDGALDEICQQPEFQNDPVCL